jgi:NADPH-dependent 2,4-dienoyl-CoA reductase/sulfur reductase-like enzyme/nitrite reductase/ring-hydroxylating ferredoxin subunit
MSEEKALLEGPDFAQGVPVSDVADGGMLLGHAFGQSALLARRGAAFYAIGATCTHYSGPLVQGLIVGETVRCPWHHACFSLKTGEALHAPALSPVAAFVVERKGDTIFVRETPTAPSPRAKQAADAPSRIVIVGGGAAGFAAAERLRHEGYQGSLVMVSDDDAPPVDRPNLSKDYLAGNAPEEWLPLRPDEFYAENGIDLRLKTTVAAIDARARKVTLADGGKLSYDRLLLATGAEPIRLPVPGAAEGQVMTLRTLADSRTIIARAASARRAVVIGASFIGLEVAASLRARGIEVHVVAPEQRPMERVLGPQIGDFVRALHEEHGVVFHLGDVAASIDGDRVTLKNGGEIEAQLVVAGVGVRPRTALAEAAGLAVDRGVEVDAYLATNAPGIFAAGDTARWPDPHGGDTMRVEHWVVAERQGQTAALNMLGRRHKFDAVPFFWSQHYDVPINYVGHAEAWDELKIEGDIAAKDCVLRFMRRSRLLAAASIYRDLDSLRIEATMEKDTAA